MMTCNGSQTTLTITSNLKMSNINETTLRMKKNSRFCDKRCSAYRKKVVNEFGYPFVWRDESKHPIEHDTKIRMLLPYIHARTYTALGQVSKYMCSTLFDRVIMKDYKMMINRMEGACDQRIIALKRSMYKHTEKPFYTKSNEMFSPLRTIRSVRWERESDIVEAAARIDDYYILVRSRVKCYLKQRKLLNHLEKKYSDLHFSGRFMRYYLEGKRYRYL